MPGMIWSAITTAIGSPSRCSSSNSVDRLAGDLRDRDLALVAEPRAELLAQRREDRPPRRRRRRCARERRVRRAEIRRLLRHQFARPCSAGAIWQAGTLDRQLTSKRVRPGRLSTRIVAAVLLDDPRARCQAEAGPLALGLGREERLEDARQRRRRGCPGRRRSRGSRPPRHLSRPWSRSRSRPARPGPASRCGSGSSTPG